jgi:hypothetical protein
VTCLGGNSALDAHELAWEDCNSSVRQQIVLGVGRTRW